MDQERANALIEEANALHNAGAKLAAAPLYLEGAQLFEPYASFALVAGDSFAAGGQPVKAAEAYRVCLAASPDHDQAWLGLGQALWKIGDVPGAREAYGHAEVAFPGDARRGCFGLFSRRS